jgi:hypothetical protein
MNIEGYWTTFKSHLFNAMDQYIPSKTLTSRWKLLIIFGLAFIVVIIIWWSLIPFIASTLCTRFSLVVRTRSKILFSLIGSVTHCCKQCSYNEPSALENLNKSLSRLTHNSTLPNVILTGDFNLPDIDWD